jgi:hypothetical protein
MTVRAKEPRSVSIQEDKGAEAAGEGRITREWA